MNVVDVHGFLHQHGTNPRIEQYNADAFRKDIKVINESQET
jgi:hypothetical protein